MGEIRTLLGDYCAFTAGDGGRGLRVLGLGGKSLFGSYVMTFTLNSFKAGYIVDYVGDYCRAY